MLQAVVLGAGLAFAAVVQPGPLQAFILAKVISSGWRRTLPAAFAPVISDGPIAALALVVLPNVPLSIHAGIRGAGGLFLLWLAWSAFRQARVGVPGAAGGHDAPRTLARAVVVNLLNPSPYVAWTLVIGPAVVAAWNRWPGEAIALVGAFYGTMVSGLAAFIVLCGSAQSLGQGTRRILGLASAAVLAALGAWQLVAALAGNAKPV
jgi:threonine/homoserine/homoserine lactone efflux protein